MPEAVLAYPALFVHLDDGQDFGHGEEESLHDSVIPPEGLAHGSAAFLTFPSGVLIARHPRLDGGAVLEEAEMLPGVSP